MDIELRKSIENLFKELYKRSEEIVNGSKTLSEASERIMNLVSSRVTAEAEGYTVDLYASFASKIKKDEYFKNNPEKLLDFYNLNLKEALNEKYHFDIKALNSYKKGIEYNEINRLYAALGVAAGTLGLGSILKYALAGVTNIPFVVIIAGAIATACVTYMKIVPKMNKRNFCYAVDKFLREMEIDVVNWIHEIECYFEDRVKTIII